MQGSLQYSLAEDTSIEGPALSLDLDMIDTDTESWKTLKTREKKLSLYFIPPSLSL
jgi:hypothetical protein